MDAETIYRSLIEKTPNLELKGAKCRYTSLNGNMFSFLTAEGGLALRLSPDDRTAFLLKHEDCVCIQYATVVKDYVLVPDSILKDSRKIKRLFATCVEIAQTLKPKPTTRKTSKTSAVKKPIKKKAAKKTASKKKT